MLSDVSRSVIVKEASFERFWESTINPATPKHVVAHWREHELTAVQRGAEIVAQLQEFTPLEGRRILDLGCGYGGVTVALALAGASVVGTDFEDQRLWGAAIRAREDHPECRVQLLQSAGEHLPFVREAFDVVVCNNVLEHVQSHRSTLTEIARVLRPGGWLYLQFPNRLSPENLKKDPHYQLFGISPLPTRLGELYVVKLRRRSRSYDVGTFPITSQVLHVLRGLGITVVRWSPAPKRDIGYLTPLLRTYRLNTVATAIVVGRKS